MPEKRGIMRRFHIARFSVSKVGVTGVSIPELSLVLVMAGSPDWVDWPGDGDGPVILAELLALLLRTDGWVGSWEVHRGPMSGHPGSVDPMTALCSGPLPPGRTRTEVRAGRVDRTMPKALARRWHRP